MYQAQKHSFPKACKTGTFLSINFRRIREWLVFPVPSRRRAVQGEPQDEIARFVIGLRNVLSAVKNKVGFNPPIAFESIAQPRRQTNQVIIAICFFQVNKNLCLKGNIKAFGKIEV